MDQYAGIDVSLEQSSVCVVDGIGRIVREAKVASEPEALVRFFRESGLAVTRIGLEAGPLLQWLHAGLSEAGFETVLLETRHVTAALSAMTVKTDRKDARGIAQAQETGRDRNHQFCRTGRAQAGMSDRGLHQVGGRAAVERNAAAPSSGLFRPGRRRKPRLRPAWVSGFLLAPAASRRRSWHSRLSAPGSGVPAPCR